MNDVKLCKVFENLLKIRDMSNHHESIIYWQERAYEHKKSCLDCQIIEAQSKNDEKLVEALKLRKEIQENFVDDYLNFEDTSVGIFGIWSITEDTVRQIYEETELKIVEWGKDFLTIVVEGYRFNIKIVSEYYDGECMDAKWEIIYQIVE